MYESKLLVSSRSPTMTQAFRDTCQGRPKTSIVSNGGAVAKSFQGDFGRRILVSASLKAGTSKGRDLRHPQMMADFGNHLRGIITDVHYNRVIRLFQRRKLIS